MKVLVTGGSGLLGSYIKSVEPNWFYPTSDAMDIVEAYQIVQVFDELELGENDVVLHCAALTGLKNCEKKISEANLINNVGTYNVMNNCKHRGIFMIYISTDYVFDGERGNYKEEDEPNPINYYGSTKYNGEVHLQQYRKSLVIRTSFCPKKWPHPAAFVDKFSSLEPVDRVGDTVRMLVRDKYRPLGILNVGGERKSFYDMAKFLNGTMGKISLKDVDLNIPKDTSMNITRLAKYLGG